MAMPGSSTYKAPHAQPSDVLATQSIPYVLCGGPGDISGSSSLPDSTMSALSSAASARARLAIESSLGGSDHIANSREEYLASLPPSVKSASLGKSSESSSSTGVAPVIPGYVTGPLSIGSVDTGSDIGNFVVGTCFAGLLNFLTAPINMAIGAIDGALDAVDPFCRSTIGMSSREAMMVSGLGALTFASEIAMASEAARESASLLSTAARAMFSGEAGAGGSEAGTLLKEGDGLSYLYQKVGPNGEHLKFGITKSPDTRYTADELGGGRLRLLTSGERSEMLALERELHKTLPIGPEEAQKFYIGIQAAKGYRVPPYIMK